MLPQFKKKKRVIWRHQEGIIPVYSGPAFPLQCWRTKQKVKGMNWGTLGKGRAPMNYSPSTSQVRTK